MSDGSLAYINVVVSCLIVACKSVCCNGVRITP